MRFANQMGIQLFETSAKENINVEEMFRAITNLVLNSKKAQRETLGDPATGRIKVNDHVRPNKGRKDKKLCCNNQPKDQGRGLSNQIHNCARCQKTPKMKLENS